MNRVFVALVSLFLIGSGCAVNQAAKNDDPRWLLMASPATEDYPWGCVNMPIAQWQPIMTYPSEYTCDHSLSEAQNMVQNPVACVAVGESHRPPPSL
jgi:hypothetical protein